MESKELIDAFRKQLVSVEEQGSAQLPVSAIKDYLSVLERDASMTQEFRNREHQGMLAKNAARHEHDIEMFKAVLEAGKSALHYLLLINGGAVVALLGMLSNLSGKIGTATLAKYLALPTLQFGLGVLLAAAGFALRYFSQACYAESNAGKERYRIPAGQFRNAAIIAAVAGYALFQFECATLL